MSDLYLTLGWDSISDPKIIKSGSLFQFSIQKSNKENHKILFVAGALGAKATHFSGAYGYCEEKAIENVKFNISFFNNLSKSSLKEITYRGYPTKKISHIQLFDKEFYYQNILKYFKTDSSNDSAKKQMSESSLVIIDYISTAHLESIQMNIPTIFFWDKNSYYLNDEYKDFFKCLIEVGICQTSPEEASFFVEQIKDNPQKWWNSEKVQKAKKKFLSKNIGTSNSLIDYLINLAT
jgi:putative transferase (TIGR04331 family)